VHKRGARCAMRKLSSEQCPLQHVQLRTASLGGGVIRGGGARPQPPGSRMPVSRISFFPEVMRFF
jgi:hypothetical protein